MILENLSQEPYSTVTEKTFRSEEQGKLISIIDNRRGEKKKGYLR